MTPKEALRAGEERLRQAGIEEAQTETEHMLMQLLGCSRADIYLSSDKWMPPELEKNFFAWIQGREKRIPLAYLLGDVFFYSLKLKVGPGCLIPRPETELLVDVTASALRHFVSEPKTQPHGEKYSPLIADIGCGSGAIALALLSEIKEAHAVLSDASSEALGIARANAKDLNLETRTEFILSDLFLNWPRERRFDLIVSNPPYLTAADLKALQPEVAYEPKMALDGGMDGLDFYRRIVQGAPDFLKPRGMLGFEVGAGQASAVCHELEIEGYEDIRVFRDHQNIERTILASAPKAQSAK